MGRRPRQFSPQFKFEVVMQLLTHQKTITELCREHQLKDSLVYRWRDEFLARAALVFDREAGTPAAAEQARVADLERMVGRLTMENEILKKASLLLKSVSPRDEA